MNCRVLFFERLQCLCFHSEKQSFFYFLNIGEIEILNIDFRFVVFRGGGGGSKFRNVVCLFLKCWHVSKTRNAISFLGIVVIFQILEFGEY